MNSAEIYYPAEDSFLLSSVIEKEIQKLAKNSKNLKFLEIGSGSGVQLETALKSGIKKENIFSCDINEEAVKHCKNLGFQCIHSDLFSGIKRKYDIIIFNPPYLPEDSKEPKSSRLSTTGGKDGSETINRFLKQAKTNLNKNGRIILLASSLTKGLDFKGYKKVILARKKLFFEQLYVLRLSFNGGS